MNSTSTMTRPHEKQTEHWVYLLDDPENERVKIGYSSTPCSRIAFLSGKHPEIDLANSVMIETDLRQLEYIVQRTFDAFRLPRSKNKDDGTEWFDRSIRHAALELARHIGRVRGHEYPVHRDLTAFAAAGRQQKATNAANRANGGQCSPWLSPAERLAELAEVAADCADVFVQILGERQLDALVTDGTRWAIARTFKRESEPEMWTDECFAWTRWVNRLGLAAHVTSRSSPGDGRSFYGVTGTRVDRHEHVGTEYIHLHDAWQAWAAGDEASAEARFFAPVAEALAGLPVRTVQPGAVPFDTRPVAGLQ